MKQKKLNFNPENDLFAITLSAVYKKGRLLNKETGQEIILREGAEVLIQIFRSDLLENNSEKRKEVILKERDCLTFKIGWRRFKIELQEDLYLTKKGNSKSRLASVKCIVMEVDGEEEYFQKIEANSLSKAITMTYNVLYKDKNTSRNRNTFQTLKWEGRPLQELRKF